MSGEAPPITVLARPSRAERVRLEQVRLLYRQLLPALGATVVNSAITVTVMWSVAKTAALIWFGCLMVISACRMVLWWFFTRASDTLEGPGKFEPTEGWSRLFLGGVALSGCAWGSAALFLYPPDSQPHQAFLAMILSGMSASAVASLGAVRPAFSMFLIPAVAPITLRLFFAGDRVSVGMGVLALCFMVLLSVVERTYNRSIEESLHHRFENLELIDSLEAARRAALEASHSKSRFLANMSHEIRTPLNGVLGMLELLLGSRLDAKQAHFAGTAHRSGVSLLHIISDVLDFSKIESGGLELEAIDFCIRDLVEETVEFLAARGQAKGLELTCFVGDDVPTVAVGDPHRLRQILTNLIANGIKFTESGEVSLRVELGAAREVDGDKGFRLAAQVRDTGIGIPNEIQEHIFGSFTQADSATTRRYGGSGLGLAISSQLVCRMGGHLTVESEVDTGSTFRFEVNLGHSEMSLQEASEARTSLLDGRVLIVDDNETNRSILEHQLSRFGLKSASCEEASLAVEMLLTQARRGEGFDIAILDMSMPGMDGIELARAIRAEPELSSLRLVMLTSMGQFGDAELAKSVGIEVYLTKPVREARLYRTLSGLQDQGATEEISAVASPQGNVRFASSVRVLLAEDHRVNQEVARALLEDVGCEVAVANDGVEALAIWERQEFDVVLMDCQMPRMDGFEATRRIHATRLVSDAQSREHGNEPTHPQTDRLVPVIALTAHALEGDREKCLEAGMVDYVTKPFGGKELFVAIARHVPHAELRSVDREQWSRGDDVSPAASNQGSTADGALLDERALDAIRALESRNNPGLMRRVMDLYAQEAPRLLDASRRALESADAEALHRAVHTLKSSSANLGATSLTEACRNLETRARSNQLSGIDGLLDEVASCLQSVLDELEHRCVDLELGEGSDDG